MKPVEEGSVNQDTCGQCREIGCCGCAGNLEGLKHCIHSIVHGELHSCDNGKSSHPCWKKQVRRVVPFASSKNEMREETESRCEGFAPNELVPRSRAQDVGHAVVVMSQGPQSITRTAQHRQMGALYSAGNSDLWLNKGSWDALSCVHPSDLPRISTYASSKTLDRGYVRRQGARETCGVNELDRG